jgi:hypothetical protein
MKTTYKYLLDFSEGRGRLSEEYTWGRNGENREELAIANSSKCKSKRGHEREHRE